MLPRKAVTVAGEKSAALYRFAWPAFTIATVGIEEPTVATEPETEPPAP